MSDDIYKIAIEKLNEDMKAMKEWVYKSHAIDWARVHQNNKKLRYIKRRIEQIISYLKGIDIERMRHISDILETIKDLIEELSFY